MLMLRKRDDRGYADHGWLKTYHTFSFADYQDRKHMGFRSLRVINEDVVAGGQGFGMHPHRDMEIVTYLLAGQLQHKDSLGHGAVLNPGEVQRITAGTGLLHSEFNPSATEPVHLYQIWLRPDRSGHTPGYDQKAFAEEGRDHRWQTIVSNDGRDGSLTFHQDATIQLANIPDGKQLGYDFANARHGWLQVLTGSVTLGDLKLQPGDGVAISEESNIHLTAEGKAEVMLFDMA